MMRTTNKKQFGLVFKRAFTALSCVLLGSLPTFAQTTQADQKPSDVIAEIRVEAATSNSFQEKVRANKPGTRSIISGSAKKQGNYNIEASFQAGRNIDLEVKGMEPGGGEPDATAVQPGFLGSTPFIKSVMRSAVREDPAARYGTGYAVAVAGSSGATKANDANLFESTARGPVYETGGRAMLIRDKFNLTFPGQILPIGQWNPADGSCDGIESVDWWDAWLSDAYVTWLLQKRSKDQATTPAATPQG